LRARHAAAGRHGQAPPVWAVYARLAAPRAASPLADGVGQRRGRAGTDLGGTIEAVIPAAEYREKLPADSHPGYDALFARAAAVHRLPFTESTPESHMAASKLMVDQADELYAVRDSKPAILRRHRRRISRGDT
jgi:hypothetical protein